NLFVPGSCLYSLRGRRAFNSEPDIGYNNVWWPHFGDISDHVRRVCWLLSGGQEVCDVAVLTRGEDMAWEAAKALYTGQIDFLYIDDVALGSASVEGGALRIGRQAFRAVVCDPPLGADEPLPEMLRAFAEAGGTVIRDGTAPDVAERLADAVGRDLHWPGAPDLRFLHYRKDDLDYYLLVNEGEEALEGVLSLGTVGAVERWDPLSGTGMPWPGRIEGSRLHTRLRLERREALVLAVDPTGQADPDAGTPPVPADVVAEIAGPWRASDLSGEAIDVPAPGDWAQARGWETYTGVLRYEATFEVSATDAEAVFVDLGRVGDIAEVWLNGQRLGRRCWAPYVLDLGDSLQPGRNEIRVEVTNSMANAYDGKQMPSGLMGPVTLRRARYLEIGSEETR
ncbi:MAG: hypothetical protein GX649_10155, partial [Chloroflexi bacterium]|nr:hypothetical protein [Chloroflexota bacterium]